MTKEQVAESVPSEVVGCCNRVIAYRLPDQPRDCCNLAICNQEGSCAKVWLIEKNFVIEYPNEHCKEGK